LDKKEIRSKHKNIMCKSRAWR